MSSMAVQMTGGLIPPPPAPVSSTINDLALLRQAALASKRSKAKQAAAAAAAGTATATSTGDSSGLMRHHSTPHLQTDRHPDREEGEISDDESSASGASTSGKPTTYVPVAKLGATSSPLDSTQATSSNMTSTVNPLPRLQTVTPTFSAPSRSYPAFSASYASPLDTSGAAPASRDMDWSPAEVAQPPMFHTIQPTFLQGEWSSVPLGSTTTAFPAFARLSVSSIDTSVSADTSLRRNSDSSQGTVGTGQQSGSAAEDPELIADMTRLNLCNMTREQLYEAKVIILDLMGWAVEPEYLVSLGISRECLEVIFSELRMRLPNNIEEAIPLAKLTKAVPTSTDSSVPTSHETTPPSGITDTNHSLSLAIPQLTATTGRGSRPISPGVSAISPANPQPTSASDRPYIPIGPRHGLAQLGLGYNGPPQLLPGQRYPLAPQAVPFVPQMQPGIHDALWPASMIPGFGAFDASPFGTSTAYGLPLHQMQVAAPFLDPHHPEQVVQKSQSPPNEHEGAFPAPPPVNHFGHSLAPREPSPVAQSSQAREEALAVEVRRRQEEEMRRRQEELARKAVIATMKMKSSNKVDAPAKVDRPVEAPPQDTDNIYDELDALIAEADMKNQREGVTTQPGFVNEVDDVEDDDEREVEEAMVGMLSSSSGDDLPDFDDPMDGTFISPVDAPVEVAGPVDPPPVAVVKLEEEIASIGPPVVARPPSPSPVPQLPASWSRSGTQSRTSPPSKPNRRPVATDLEAQPFSKPEAAPVNGKPYYVPHHRRYGYEAPQPFIIDISDTETEEESDLEHAPPKPAPPVRPVSRLQRPGSTRIATPSVTTPVSGPSNGFANLTSEEARLRLEEKEREIKLMAEKIARLEEERRKKLVANKVAPVKIDPSPTVSTSVVPVSHPFPATEVAPLMTTPPTAPSTTITTPVESESSAFKAIFGKDPSAMSADIEMNDTELDAEHDRPIMDESKMAENAVEDDGANDKLNVINEPNIAAFFTDGNHLQGAGYISAEDQLMIDQPPSSLEGPVEPRGETSAVQARNYFEQYTSLFERFPLLRSHAPPLFVPLSSDLQSSTAPGKEYVDLWPLKLAKAAGISRITPDTRLCQFETSGGICRDDACPDTHARDMIITESQLAKHLVTLYPILAEHQLKQALEQARLAQPNASIDIIAASALVALGAR